MEELHDNIQLDILSPERSLFSGKVSKVTLPGQVGPFTVLRDHAPIISILTAGEIVYTHQSQEVRLPIAGGFVEVCGNEVSACIEEAHAPGAGASAEKSSGAKASAERNSDAKASAEKNSGAKE